MSKLIDADVLNEYFMALIRTARNKAAANVAFTMQKEVNELPDASKPLLTRIAELEGVIHKWEEIGKRLADHWTDVEMDKIIDDANALTGAQDA